MPHLVDVIFTAAQCWTVQQVYGNVARDIKQDLKKGNNSPLKLSHSDTEIFSMTNEYSIRGTADTEEQNSYSEARLEIPALDILVKIMVFSTPI